MNVLFDGPCEVKLDGDRATFSGTSAGKRLTMTVRLEDALITQHRFQTAYASRTHGEVVSVNFSKARQADTAC
jgi:hypothetical protein